MDEGMRVELTQRERLPLMSENDWAHLIDRYFAGRYEGYEAWDRLPDND